MKGYILESLAMLYNPLKSWLEKNKICVLDGGLATEMYRLNIDLSSPLWSAQVLKDQPDLITQIHYRYLESGANCITTASYQATPQMCAQLGLSDNESQDIILSSVACAQKARANYEATHQPLQKPLIAASIGPYGAYLADGSEFSGNYDLSKEELKEFHRLRVRWLGQSEVDLMAFETIPCLQEAQAYLELLEEENIHKYAWLSFSCRDESHISNGESFSKAVKTCSSNKRVAALGINCTAPHHISALLKSASSPIPYVVYPNVGGNWDPEHKIWDDTAQKFGHNHIHEWYNLGARLIGGCCGTSFEHTKMINEEI